MALHTRTMLDADGLTPAAFDVEPGKKTPGTAT